MRCNNWVLGSGAGAIVLGYSGLLIYYAVWSPTIAAQAPIATHLQDVTVQRIEDNIVQILNESRTQVSAMSRAISHDLSGNDDSWPSLERLQGELWGPVVTNQNVANTVFQSTTNLSTAYYRNGSIYEYSRTDQESMGIEVTLVDDSGKRTDTLPTLVSTPPLHERPWYTLALANNDSVAVSSTFGIFGTPLITFSSVVWDGHQTLRGLPRIRGVVSMGYAVPQIEALLNMVDPIATIYLLPMGSTRLISSVPKSSTAFLEAADSGNPVISQSAISLNSSLLDEEDHRGTISVDGKRYFYAIRKFGTSFNVTIVSLLPRSFFFKQVDASRRITIGIFVTAIVLWFFSL